MFGEVILTLLNRARKSLPLGLLGGEDVVHPPLSFLGTDMRRYELVVHLFEYFYGIGW